MQPRRSHPDAVLACFTTSRRQCHRVSPGMHPKQLLAGYCNEGRATNPVNDVYGPHADFDNTEMNNPVLDTLPHTVAQGGAFPRCISSYGAFDMHGNVHEWCVECLALLAQGLCSVVCTLCLW